MSGEQETILLVEDDSNDIMLIKRAFHKAQINARLETITDGDQAVAYLSHQPPYDNRDRYPLPVLILLDLKLPRRSGLEVLAWLRQQPEIKRTLVIVLSSSKESPDIDKAYDLGINSYLVKPVTFEDLVELMNQVHKYWFNFNQRPGLLNK
ncbi:MAG: response regulator [Spirulinaceae cyanobacterium]